MSEDSEQGAKDRGAKAAALAGKKREAEGAVAGREPQPKRQKSDEVVRSGEEEDTESEDDEDSEDEEEMEVDQEQVADTQKKQAN